MRLPLATILAILTLAAPAQAMPTTWPWMVKYQHAARTYFKGFEPDCPAGIAYGWLDGRNAETQGLVGWSAPCLIQFDERRWMDAMRDQRCVYYLHEYNHLRLTQLGVLVGPGDDQHQHRSFKRLERGYPLVCRRMA